MKYSVLSLCLASLSLACGGGGGGSEVSMGAVNGVDANDASFAIFNVSATPFDSDDDGVEELDRAQLTVVVSDQADLCAQLEDPFGQQGLLDIKSVQIIAIKAAALGDGLNAFAANDQLNSNQFLLNFFQGGAAQDDMFVDTIVQIKEDADLLVDASGLGFVDFDEISDSDLSISEFTVNTSLSADFSITLGGDIADENTFDTDANNDGSNDYRLLNVPLSVRVVDASFCAALAPL
jgi:hypothetical protein